MMRIGSIWDDDRKLNIDIYYRYLITIDILISTIDISVFIAAHRLMAAYGRGESRVPAPDGCFAMEKATMATPPGGEDRTG